MTPITSKRENVVALIARATAISEEPQVRSTQTDIQRSVEPAQRGPTPETEYEKALAADPAASVVLSTFPFAPQETPQASGETDSLQTV